MLTAYYTILSILNYKGQDLTGLPLLRRKRYCRIIPPFRHFWYSAYVEGAGEAFFNQIETLSMEGVVGKRKNSIYEFGRRSHAWQKVYVEIYITGYRKHEFGWLAVVPDPHGKLRPAGIIELGASPLHKQAFRGVA